jgi:hypothetical protein
VGEEILAHCDSLEATVSRVLAQYPEWEPVWRDISQPEEVLSFVWGLRTIIPLRDASQSEWLVTTYEDLVVDGKDEIRRVLQFLEWQFEEELLEQMRQPSSTTKSDSNVAQERNPLRTWKKRLHPEQARNILSVTTRMGADFYSEDLIPHKNRLLRMRQTFST